MLAKLSALLTSKVALAAIGGTLVVGSTVTVAAAATGHLPTNVEIPGITHSQNDTQDNANGKGHHAHTIAIEGTLTGYDASAHTITVTGKADDEGDTQTSSGDDNQSGSTTAGGSTSTSTVPADGAATGTSTSTSTSTTNTSTSTSTSTTSNQDAKCTFSNPVTIAVDGGTKYTGQVKKEADLANATNRHIQVQATASSDCKTLTAWKVTVGGKGDTQDHGKTLEGKVGTVGSGNFTVQPEHGAAVTVNVTTSTKFEGAAHSLGDLKGGMAVEVLGTLQTDGSVNADMVVTEGSDGHGNGNGGSGGNSGSQGQRTEIGGAIASVGAAGSNTFTVTTQDNQTVTVLVSSNTVYYGDARSFNDLKAGMRVAAAGTMQSNSLQATSVAAEASSGHD